jgi:GDP-mannose 6-dehydrogenase
MNVSVLGLGSVGAVSALCLTRDGHNVIGCDIDSAKLELLRKFRSFASAPRPLQGAHRT